MSVYTCTVVSHGRLVRAPDYVKMGQTKACVLKPLSPCITRGNDPGPSGTEEWSSDVPKFIWDTPYTCPSTLYSKVLASRSRVMTTLALS